MDIKYAYSVYRLLQMILLMTISLNAWMFWFHLLSKLFIDYNESEPNCPNKNIVYDVGRIMLAGFWYNNKPTYDVRYLS